MIQELTKYEGSYPPAENIDRVLSVLNFIKSVEYIPIELIEITRRNPNQQSWITFKQKNPFAYYCLKALFPESSKDDFKIMNQLDLIEEYQDKDQISSIKNYIENYFEPIIDDDEYHKAKDNILTFLDKIDSGIYFTLSKITKNHYDELLEDKALMLYQYLKLIPRLFGFILNKSYLTKIDKFSTSKSLTDWIDKQLDSIDGRVKKHSKSSSVEAVNIRRWMTWFGIIKQYNKDYEFDLHMTNELIFRAILYLINEYVENNQIRVDEIQKNIKELSLNPVSFIEQIRNYNKLDGFTEEEIERGYENNILIVDKDSLNNLINERNFNFVYMPF